VALQFRRGTAAQRVAATEIPDLAEPWFTYDDGKLYVGDGVTPGGVNINTGGAVSELSDVTLISSISKAISSYSITSNVVTVVLSSDHSFYQGLQVTIAGSPVTALNGTRTITTIPSSTSFTFALTASNIASTNTTGTVTGIIPDGGVLTWNATEGYWEDQPPTGTIATLEDVALTSLANGQSLIYNSATNKWINSTPATNLDGLTDVVISTPTSGQVLTYDGTNFVNGTVPLALPTRVSVSGTTSSIANNTSANITITGFKSYILYSVQTSAAAWVTIYSSSAARTADASRTVYIDPTPGSGVIAEVANVAAETQKITPGVLGFNDESPVTTNIYLKVENNSGSTAAITVTLKLLQLEV